MTLYFITASKNKFLEVQAMIPNIKQLEVDLPEIQELDAQKIIAAKIKEAFSHKKGEFIVEDTSLYLEGLNGLPGPLIKWFMKTIGNEGLARLAEQIKNMKAHATTIIGYARSASNIHFFEGTIKGTIVAPRGDDRFGWDVIFKPNGYEKTYAEMTQEEKNAISMRRQALEKFKTFLEES